MSSGGKEGKRREELAAAQKAYRALAAKEERQRNRISKRDMAMNASMRALVEVKAYILRMPPQDKPKGLMDPQSATVSLINRAMREIKRARDS